MCLWNTQAGADQVQCIIALKQGKSVDMFRMMQKRANMTYESTADVFVLIQSNMFK